MEATLFRRIIDGAIKNKHLVFLFLVPATNLLFTPIQTRLIEPALLGTYTAYTSLIGLIVIFASLKSETLIFYAQNENDQMNVGKTSIHLLKFSTLFFSIALTIFWYYYSSFNVNQTITVLLLTPFIIFGYGVDGISRIFLIRKGASEYYYKLSFFRNLVKNLAIVVLPGLIAAQLFLLLCSELIGRLMSFGKQMKSFSTGVVKKEILPWLIENRKTTIYYALSLFVNAVTASLPLLLIQKNNAHDGGIYSMFYRLFAIPAMLIATFFADKLSAASNNNIQAQKKIISVLFLLSALTFLFMQFMPVQVYTMFLGSAWSDLQPVVKALSLSVALEMFFSAISIIFVLQKTMHVKYYFDGIYVLATIVPFFIFTTSLTDQLSLLNILRSSVTLFFTVVILLRLKKTA